MSDILKGLPLLKGFSVYMPIPRIVTTGYYASLRHCMFGEEEQERIRKSVLAGHTKMLEEKRTITQATDHRENKEEQ